MSSTHKPIDLRAPGAIDDLLTFHRATFGCAVMEEGETPPAAPAAPAPVPTPPAAPAADGDKPLGPNGEKALQSERDARKALEATVTQMQAAQKAQSDALAKALGVKPEEASDADKLAGQVTGLSDQVATLLKTNLVLSITAEHKLSDEDKAVIASLPDEATMRTVAARLATAAAPSGKPKGDPPATPRPGSTPVDLPGVSRLRAAYEASETN